MQDFKIFDYIIDIDGIIKANKDGQSIDIIINGEHYDFIPEKKTEKAGYIMRLIDFMTTVKTENFIIKVDNGCDFEYLDILTYDSKKHGDYIVTGSCADNDKFIIECDMVGLDNDGIKRNFSTWEPIQ
jgi:hypothetical protein